MERYRDAHVPRMLYALVQEGLKNDSGLRSFPTTMIWLLASCTLLFSLTATVVCDPSHEQEILSSVYVSETDLGNITPTLRRFHLDLGSKPDVSRLLDNIEVCLFILLEVYVEVLLYCSRPVWTCGMLQKTMLMSCLPSHTTTTNSNCKIPPFHIPTLYFQNLYTIPHLCPLKVSKHGTSLHSATQVYTQTTAG